MRGKESAPMSESKRTDKETEEKKETAEKTDEDRPIISFKNVSKIYTLYRNSREQFAALFYSSKKRMQHRALDDVSFEIRKGESVAIIGRNGAGKSTLLKMITGVAFPSSGEIRVKGRVSALLELTAGFIPDMTGRENIRFRCYVFGLRDKAIDEIEQRAIAFADLKEYIDQPVRTYSSGMRVRLGFAININMDPDILVIDEALSVGDNNFKQKCKAKINELIKKNVTVLYVSHNKDIQDFCKRCIYLQNGKVEFDGPMSEAVKKYPEFTG